MFGVGAPVGGFPCWCCYLGVVNRSV